MSSFNGFEQRDFNVFTIDGLEERMEALRSRISTKLEAIANHLEPDLSSLSGDEMFVHVAKHARRTKILRMIHGLHWQAVREDIRNYHISRLVCGSLTYSSGLRSFMKVQ